jgi:hypothetical protein
MRFFSINRVTGLLGEEPLSIRLAVPCRTGFFPVDRWNGYRVTQEGHRITIAPVAKAALLGWSPVFYFTGRLQGEGGTSIVQGRITMKLSSKIFILAWAGIVLLGLTFGSIYALESAFRWLLNPTETALAALQGAGLMVGIGVCMLFFAAFLFFVMGFFNRKERQRLKDFCKSCEV